jgi:hypothetical protein
MIIYDYVCLTPAQNKQVSGDADAITQLERDGLLVPCLPPPDMKNDTPKDPKIFELY